jgi:Domain of unknown function (DUF4261)
MTPEFILCIPGKWSDRTDFLHQIIASEPKGSYLFAGMILLDTEANDNVPLEFCAADSHIPEAFEIAGQGRIPADILAQLREHTAVVYLHFPLDLPTHRERILKFTQLLQRLGGMAIKVESAGVAHTWQRWFSLLQGNPFEVYSAVVALIGDKNYYYSCGMHHFGLPECEAPRSVPIAEAADLMNEFNFWQLTEHPNLSDGHTFSLNSAAPRFRLSLVPDIRHEKDHLFHNPHGIWRLDAV